MGHKGCLMFCQITADEERRVSLLPLCEHAGTVCTETVFTFDIYNANCWEAWHYILIHEEFKAYKCDGHEIFV
jgi:hypothetical protein